MSWLAKTAAVALIVVANLAILWWRYEHQVPEIKGVGPTIAALGAAQANTVLGWRNAASEPLTLEAINEYVERMQWGDCANLSSIATTLSRDEISPQRQKVLCRTVAGLINAYAQSKPERLYDFMLSIDEELSPSSVATLRRLLTSDIGMSAAAVTTLEPRDLFVTMCQRIRYGPHWQSLVVKSGCVTVWRTDLGRDRVFDEMPLGGTMANLFKNQTRFNHLFEPTAKNQNVSAKDVVFADVQFVVKHDRSLMSEPSAYHIRLSLEPNSDKWYPIEMVHVSTISGNSPVILF